MSDKYLNLTGLQLIKEWVITKLGVKQDKLTAGKGVKILSNGTINCTEVKTSSGGGVEFYEPDDGSGGGIAIDPVISFTPLNTGMFVQTGKEGEGKEYYAASKVMSEIMFLSNAVGAKIGTLSSLNTDAKDNLVNAINEVYEKSGEPFRVKNWAANNFSVSIPTVTTDIANTQIGKLVFSIDAEEGADYQIVGMIAYEVFDAVSGGNRINCFPVCQFTGNGQKELGVRFMCGGTSAKVAKRINAWVLLKHR